CALAVGFAAIAGHMFSPFVGFKGGKGVATSLGVFLAVTPLPMLICFAISAAIIGVTGYVSLASITGAVLLPILIFVFSSAEARPWPVIVLTALLGAFVIYKHSANITRLMNGTENKILRKKKPEGA
ncbi:glycerol-3-phosphate acyltransferase, partial [Candidatus Sumerlaeota bacterium]|nr:glycerol-3-phosphate acyltransferase [Candidatus Sumerlaeota bacterium]